MSILLFSLLTIPIDRTPAQATVLSPAEMIICLLALFPCHQPFSKQEPEGSFVRGHIMSVSAQNPLLSFTEKARVLALACKAPVLSASLPLSSFCCSLHSSHPCLLAISKTYCHLRTFTPVTAFLQKALPQTDEWPTPFHCKFLSNVTFSVMPAPIILFKIAAPSSPSPTELPSLLFSP